MASIRTNLPLTAERLKSQLLYYPETGVFTRLTVPNNRCKIGDVAGRINQGYRLITIDGVAYFAHRLAWLYVNGEWPEELVDHRDGNRDNNRYANLRECANDENQQNIGIRSVNTSGYTGAIFDKRLGRWRGAIKRAGKAHYLGAFDTPAEAGRAYLAAKQTFHEFQPVPRGVPCAYSPL